VAGFIVDLAASAKKRGLNGSLVIRRLPAAAVLLEVVVVDLVTEFGR